MSEPDGILKNRAVRREEQGRDEVPRIQSIGGNWHPIRKTDWLVRLQEPSVVVTLGIGLDVKAEETLKKTMPYGSRFFAADPIHKGNAELFEPIGSYFPFAVGKEIDVSNALVLKNGTDFWQSSVYS